MEFSNRVTILENHNENDSLDIYDFRDKTELYVRLHNVVFSNFDLRLLEGQPTDQWQPVQTIKYVTNLIQRLTEMQPRRHLRLKYIVLNTYNLDLNCIGYSKYLHKLIETIGLLITRPVLVMDSNIYYISQYDIGIRFGNISKFYLLSEIPPVSKAFDSMFHHTSMVNSNITDMGVITLSTQKIHNNLCELSVESFLRRELNKVYSCISRPRDEAMIADEIVHRSKTEVGRFFVDTNTYAENQAYRVRYNRDIANTYNTICTMLYLNHKNGAMNWIPRLRDDGKIYKHPNPWSILNRDLFFLIMREYVSQNDWNESYAKCKRMTIKSPKWAHEIISNYKSSDNELYKIEDSSGKVKYLLQEQKILETRLVDIQDRLMKIPDEIEKLKKDDATVDERKQAAFEEFRTKCQYIVDVRDKKIKIPRKKVVKKKRDEESLPDRIKEDDTNMKKIKIDV